MNKFQEKNKWKTIVHSKPALILFGIIIFGFTWNVFGLMGRMQETIKSRRIEENKILELERREKKLSFDIESLKTEKGVEENIREKFGLVKDGEGVIIVVENENKIPKEIESNGFISFFKNFFN